MAKNSPSGLALLVRAPGEQRGITDGDDGDPETEVGLYSEAAFCLVGVGTGATEGSVQDPWEASRGRGHQCRRMPVNGYLGHV